MLLCAITDGTQLPGSQPGFEPGFEPASQAGSTARREALLRRVESWARGGVTFIQLREKTLDASELQSLAAEIVARVKALGSAAQVLVNGPAEVALAAGAHGVHLAGPPVAGSVERLRALFRAAGRDATVSMACHSPEEAAAARAQSADLLLYAPVFEKPVFEKPVFEKPLTPAEDLMLNAERPPALAPVIPAALPGQGLDALRRACIAAAPIPVYALGGIAADNAAQCIAAGAAGVAGIRLFARNGWQHLASRLS